MAAVTTQPRSQAQEADLVLVVIGTRGLSAALGIGTFALVLQTPFALGTRRPCSDTTTLTPQRFSDQLGQTPDGFLAIHGLAAMAPATHSHTPLAIDSGREFLPDAAFLIGGQYRRGLHVEQ
jgi:hypothetical protein